MSDIKDEPAFPQTIDDMGTMRSVTQGMTMLDYFAAKALQGLISNHGGYDSNSGQFGKNYEDGVHEAYRFADAMLAEKAKRKP